MLRGPLRCPRLRSRTLQRMRRSLRGGGIVLRGLLFERHYRSDQLRNVHGDASRLCRWSGLLRRGVWFELQRLRQCRLRPALGLRWWGLPL